MPRLPSFKDRFGLRGAAITAVDLIRGVALAAGWKLIEVPGANGYIDTNYAGKGQYAIDALDDVDIMAVHIEAPDEMGHNGDARNKVKALERIDEHIVGPLLEKLRSFDAWRILVCPDHPTPVGKRTHTATPPCFCMAGTGVVPDRAEAFSEADASETGLQIDPGHELMEYFLLRPGMNQRLQQEVDHVGISRGSSFCRLFDRDPLLDCGLRATVSCAA